MSVVVQPGGTQVDRLHVALRCLQCLQPAVLFVVAGSVFGWDWYYLFAGHLQLAVPQCLAVCEWAWLGTCKGLRMRLVAQACLHGYLFTGGLQQAGVFRLQSRV